MKKILFGFMAITGLAIGLSSCGKADCVTCTSPVSVTICEDDYNNASGGSGVTWEDYKNGLLQSPDCSQ